MEHEEEYEGATDGDEQSYVLLLQELEPVAPSVESAQVVGAGVGNVLSVGTGDGTLPSLYPPPQAQHMSAAVKSSSLYQVGHDDGE